MHGTQNTSPTHPPVIAEIVNQPQNSFHCGLDRAPSEAFQYHLRKLLAANDTWHK